MRSPVVFDDINFTSRSYDPWHAIRQSKTASVLFAVEVTRRWAGDLITAKRRGLEGGLQKAIARANRT